MKKVIRVLEKKSSTTHNELQALIGFFLVVANVVYLNQAFFCRFYGILA